MVWEDSTQLLRIESMGFDKIGNAVKWESDAVKSIKVFLFLYLPNLIPFLWHAYHHVLCFRKSLQLKKRKEKNKEKKTMPFNVHGNRDMTEAHSIPISQMQTVRIRACRSCSVLPNRLWVVLSANFPISCTFLNMVVAGLWSWQDQRAEPAKGTF